MLKDIKVSGMMSLLVTVVSGVLFFSKSLAVAAEPNTVTGQKQPPESILLTVFLRHDQSKSLKEIQEIQKQQEFFKKFPPAGVDVVSWNVVMGIGQVVVLQVPAHKLRDVNVALESSAWKAFKTEFYPTYNLYPIIQKNLANQSKVNY